MNPMTNVKNVLKLNERELAQGTSGRTSWHRQYQNSAWVFIGGLPYELTEGDVITVFSQYGEVVNMNLVRDKLTGKSKGFCFLCYEDQRSTVLAVDNLNAIKLLGRTLRVDHCEKYRQPKDTGDEDDLTKTMRMEGCAPTTGVNTTSPTDNQKSSQKHKKEKKKKHRRDAEANDERNQIKKEKLDLGFENEETTEGMNRNENRDSFHGRLSYSRRTEDNPGTVFAKESSRAHGTSQTYDSRPFNRPTTQSSSQKRDSTKESGKSGSGRKKMSINKLLAGPLHNKKS